MRRIDATRSPPSPRRLSTRRTRRASPAATGSPRGSRRPRLRIVTRGWCQIGYMEEKEKESGGGEEEGGGGEGGGMHPYRLSSKLNVF
jgi:hypothetical protein